MIALALRYWWAIAIAALLALVGIQQLRVDRAQKALAEYKLEQAQLTQAAEKAAREREQTMQKQAATIEEAKDEQIRIIGDQLDTALASLSKRTNRPSGNVSKPGAACKGATGSSLSAEDAGFLYREAARADKLRMALDACYRHVDTISKP